MKDTIFVQIASYRDPELSNTLLSLIENAKNPENLYITVCWQHSIDESLKTFIDKGFEHIETVLDEGYSQDAFELHYLTLKNADITFIDVSFEKSKGACWARNLIQKNYRGEKYSLQLDSHHRFTENWDQKVIEMLESVRKDSEYGKPVLTAYVPSFDPEKDPESRVQKPWEMTFDRFIPEGAIFFMPREIPGWKKVKKPVRARFYSAHFCFADGSFAYEVPHDPEYFFHGEEISIGVRAFTHGYDLYHPHRVICWHEYTRKGRVKVWDDHTQQNKEKGMMEKHWLERNNECHLRNRTLFGMDGLDPQSIDFGRYGFGNHRTLRDYEIYAGISFKNRAVKQYTLDHNYPPNPYNGESEEEWEKNLTVSNDIRVLISYNDLDPIEVPENDTRTPKELLKARLLPKYDVWIFTANDSEGNEIFRKDYSGEEIEKKLDRYANDWILDYQEIFLHEKEAKSWSMLISANGKWQNRIVKLAK